MDSAMVVLRDHLGCGFSTGFVSVQCGSNNLVEREQTLSARIHLL